ncbi:acyl-homoserine-lactone synthase [Aliiruegeria sabulilitoris]|uniref:acyl-homoserine-lactone synthase n=1 Tax=Aliiruegeria sabulilitoris TaxID=1510458 RepID=UPI0008366F9A|nr:acyl-homoserine-lactone synthase [Aliiruegeria sabulilitoris]NDR58970.1 autoinducer synthase [Pseudoruegeria sp. M32A2M]
MLRYVYGTDLDRFAKLRDTMFQDRAEQFSHRLGWEVSVNSRGEERDQYDVLNPLYVIWELEDGSHGGSMRFLPTSGRTMINEHFSHLLDGVKIESPFIWECTRFCISPQADRRAAAALVLGGGELMDNFMLSHFCGVFDPRMERIYRLYHVDPDIIGMTGEGKDRIGAGLWEMKPEAWAPTLKRLGIDRETSRSWFDLSFNRAPRHPIAATA